MTRSHIFTLLAVAVAAPAVAVTAAPYLYSHDAPCLSAGSVGYRLTSKRDADYAIKIDNTAASPDLKLQIVSDPGIADFVLVDGADNSATCGDARTIRTIRIDAQTSDADLIIALAPAETAGSLKIYAHSANFTAQDAAALFAVMWKSGRKRELAAR